MPTTHRNKLNRLYTRLAPGTPLISEADLRDAIAFITALGKALEDLVLANVAS